MIFVFLEINVKSIVTYRLEVSSLDLFVPQCSMDELTPRSQGEVRTESSAPDQRAHAVLLGRSNVWIGLVAAGILEASRSFCLCPVTWLLSLLQEETVWCLGFPGLGFSTLALEGIGSAPSFIHID